MSELDRLSDDSVSATVPDGGGDLAAVEPTAEAMTDIEAELVAPVEIPDASQVAEFESFGTSANDDATIDDGIATDAPDDTIEV